MKPKKTSGKNQRKGEDGKTLISKTGEDRRLFFLFFTIGFSLLIGGFWINSAYPHPTAYVLNGYRSAAFRQLGEPDPLAEPKSNEAQFVEGEQLEFLLPKPAGAVSAYLAFVFRCEPECGPLWLDARTQEEKWLSVLAWDPRLDGLAWFYTQEKGLTIFQRNLPPKSLAEIQKGIMAEKIAVDPGLVGSSSAFPPGTPVIEPNLRSDALDYIVTSYFPQSKLGSWHRFGNQISIRFLKSDTQGNLLLRFRKEGNYKLWIARPEARFW